MIAQQRGRAVVATCADPRCRRPLRAGHPPTVVRLARGSFVVVPLAVTLPHLRRHVERVRVVASLS